MMLSKWRVAQAAVVAIALQCALPISAQQASSLTITSPSNETVVQPGRSLQALVSGSGVSQWALVGTNPIGTTALQPGTASSAVTLSIPAQINPGRYFLTAVGTDSTGNLVVSASVSVRVPASGVTAIQSDPATLFLMAPGNQGLLVVQGTTVQGLVNLFPSDLLYSSANPAIASVNANGMIIGQSPGTTLLTASYPGTSQTLTTTATVIVGGALRGDLNNDGQVDLEDEQILTAALNSPANGPNDARDLNHDGVINALDARMLVTLCTHPSCATH